MGYYMDLLRPVISGRDEEALIKLGEEANLAIVGISNDVFFRYQVDLNRSSRGFIDEELVLRALTKSIDDALSTSNKSGLAIIDLTDEIVGRVISQSEEFVDKVFDTVQFDCEIELKKIGCGRDIWVETIREIVHDVADEQASRSAGHWNCSIL